MAHNPMHTAQVSSGQTAISPSDISAMVAARICHDLVSPLGAIGNGVELLQICESVSGGELELIAQSTANASAKLRFFRVAFGPVSDGQRISSTEIQSILKALGGHQKHTLLWSCDGDLTRRQVKLAFLLLMCLETALPWGGEILVSASHGQMTLCARADRLKIDDNLWTAIRYRTPIAELSSARIQFALAVAELQEQARNVTVHEQASSLTIDLTVE